MGAPIRLNSTIIYAQTDTIIMCKSITTHALLKALVETKPKKK